MHIWQAQVNPENTSTDLINHVNSSDLFKMKKKPIKKKLLSSIVKTPFRFLASLFMNHAKIGIEATTGSSNDGSLRPNPLHDKNNTGSTAYADSDSEENFPTTGDTDFFKLVIKSKPIASNNRLNFLSSLFKNKESAVFPGSEKDPTFLNLY